MYSDISKKNAAGWISFLTPGLGHLYLKRRTYFLLQFSIFGLLILANFNRESISVLVGDKVLGRILNVVGEPIDEAGPVEATEKWSIHREAPKFEDQSTKAEMHFA